MSLYFIISILLTLIYPVQFNQEELKQAKVIEFISTKSIEYIDNLKDNGDDKYYHFQKH